MEVKVINYAPSDNNTYVVIENDHCLLIDPSTTDGRIESLIKSLNLDMILLTHGHYDHFTDVNALHRRYPNVKILLNQRDHGLAAGDPPLFGNQNGIVLDPTILSDLDESSFQWQNQMIYVYAMPGHSPGSLVYHIGNYLFCGDVLFDDSIGRDDLPLGNGMDLRRSLQRFTMFDDQTIIASGHGPCTILGNQWKTNPYLMHIHH